MKGRQFLVSLLTGVFGASAYLTLPMAAVGWIWPFLIVLGSPARLRDAFFHGWTVGSSFFGVSLYWLWNNPFPAGAVPGWFALSLYTGLYIGVWSVFCVHTWKSMCPGGRDWSRISYVCCFSSWPGWWQRLLWVVGSAGAWVALEWVRSYALTGFPWNLLGVSQASMPVVTWVAGLGGVLLVSWIVCAGSILLGFGVLQVFRCPGNPAAGIREAFPAFLIFIGLIGGFPRTAQDTGPSISVAAIQPGFTQWEIWNSEESARQAMWDRVISLTDQALSSHPKPELVIWPEGAAPRIGDKELERIANMAAENQTAFAVCLETSEADHSNGNPAYRYYNSALFIDSQGRWQDEEGHPIALYHKQHLVPFGEFIPMESRFPWLSKWIPIGSFHRGQKPGYFYWTEKGIHLAFCICFEDSFWELIRSSTEARTQLIINMTNDAWFGKSSAQWVHAQHAQFRSIELGIPMVRATNNGLTCWVSPRGTMNGIHFSSEPQTSIHGAGYKIFEIPLPGEARETWFRKTGDWVGPSSFLLAISFLIFCRLADNFRAGDTKEPPQSMLP